MAPLFTKVRTEVEQLSQDAWKHWTRRKNLTILLLFGLYLLVETALWYNRTNGPFVPEKIIILVGALPLVFITFFFAHLVIRIVSPFISRFFRDELEPEQRIFFVKLFEIISYILAITYILYSFNASWDNIALVMGFISGGLAFAFREPIMAFLIWLIILSKKPFRIGDNVRIGDYEGLVERIGTFFITLRSSGRITEQSVMGERIVRIPNGLVMQSYLENFGQHPPEQVLRMQLRTIPKNIPTFLREVRVTASDTLHKNGVEPEITIQLENTNAIPGDKQFVVLRYHAPIGKRDHVRSQLVQALLTQQRKIFTP